MMSVAALGPLVIGSGFTGSLRPRERAVLAALVVGSGQCVAPDRLAHALWVDDLPGTWPKQIQASIGLIRKSLGPEAVVTSPAGYRLTLDADAIDVRRFEHLVERARGLARSGDHDRAAATFDRALALWRGTPFEDLANWQPAVIEACRLDEVRMSVEEEALLARLAAGEHRSVAAAAEALAAEEPLREQRWVILAIAQYRCGRQADALRSLQRARHVLVEELGIEPGRDLAELERAILQQDPKLDGTTSAPVVNQVCPYPGLAAYDVSDHPRFFGRRREIDQCLARLAEHGLLILTGASGQGKSSLARAGLAATLEATGRVVRVITPGPDPVASVLAALDAVGDAAIDSGMSPVIVIDQFEEVYADADRRDARDLGRVLAEQLDAGRAAVVIVIRADHLTDLAADPDLGTATAYALHFVAALDGDALRAAIEEPAIEAGLRVEPGLVDALVADARDQAGALPLLSHALVETWRRRDGNVLTIEGYRASGGIQGAVARSADRVYDSLDPDQRELLRSLLLRLVMSSAEGDVLRCRLDVSVLRGDPNFAHLIGRLVDARLVTAETDTVELAHEALARAWPRLRGWLDEDTESQRVLRHLSTTAAGWESLGRPDSELYRGARLEAALEHTSNGEVRLAATETEFLAASRGLEVRTLDELKARARTDERRVRRLRLALVSTATTLTLALLAGFVAVERGRDAAASRADAQLAALVNQSLALRASDRSAAVLLAVEAFRRAPDDPRAKSALLAGFTAAPGFLGHRYLSGHDRMIGTVLPGGDRAVVAVGSGDVLLVDLTAADQVSSSIAIPREEGWIDAVAVSADARSLAILRSVGVGRGRIVVHDIGSGERVGEPIALEAAPARIAIGPDGEKVAVTMAGTGALDVFDVASGTRVGGLEGGADANLEPGDSDVGAVAFAADGDVVVGSVSGPLRILDASTLFVQASIDVPVESASQFLHIGADGRAVAVGHEGMVGVDLAAGTVAWSADLRGRHPIPCTAFAADERSQRIYCGNAYGVVEERDRTDGRTTGLRLDPQLGFVDSIATSSDGTIVTTFGAAISQWSLTGDGLVTDVVAPGHVTVDGYEPIAGRRLFVGRRDPTVSEAERLGQVAVWDPDGDPTVGPLEIDGEGAGWMGPDLVSVVDFEHETPHARWYHTGDGAFVDGAVIPLIPCDQFLVSAGGARLYCAGTFGEVWAVDTVTRERIGPTIGVEGAVNTVSATRDGERVVVTAFGPAGPATTVHDGKTGAMLAGPLIGPWRSAVSLDGHLLAATDGTLTRYHLDTLEPLGDLPGARGEINLIQFSEDGRTALAAANDQTVSLYDVESGIRLGDPIHVDAPFGYAGFLRPDGLQAAVTGSAGVTTWDLDPDHLLDAACLLAGRNLTETEWASYLVHLGAWRETCPAVGERRS